MEIIPIEPILTKPEQKIQKLCQLIQTEHPDISELIIKTVLLYNWRIASNEYYANNKSKVSELKKVDYQKHKEELKIRYKLKKQTKLDAIAV